MRLFHIKEKSNLFTLAQLNKLIKWMKVGQTYTITLEKDVPCKKKNSWD